jgi:hypothetical protein
MKISDVLRHVATAIEQAEDPGQPDDQIQNPARLSPTAGGMPVDNVDNQDLGADDDIMIPPLQLKMELLKRAVDVDNVYDPGETRADQAHDNQEQDMIILLKKNAGIPTAAVMELSNDDIFDD